jgi:hypothetical protein
MAFSLPGVTRLALAPATCSAAAAESASRRISQNESLD